MSVLPGKKRWLGSRCFNLKDLAPSHSFIHIQDTVTRGYFVPGNVLRIKNRIRSGGGLGELSV